MLISDIDFCLALYRPLFGKFDGKTQSCFHGILVNNGIKDVFVFILGYKFYMK